MIFNEELVPDGWRLNTIDASILGSYSVMLKRDKDGSVWWHKLTEEEQADIPLFATGSAGSLSEALNKAINETIQDENK